MWVQAPAPAQILERNNIKSFELTRPSSREDYESENESEMEPQATPSFRERKCGRLPSIQDCFTRTSAENSSPMPSPHILHHISSPNSFGDRTLSAPSPARSELIRRMSTASLLSPLLSPRSLKRPSPSASRTDRKRHSFCPDPSTTPISNMQISNRRRSSDQILQEFSIYDNLSLESETLMKRLAVSYEELLSVQNLARELKIRNSQLKCQNSRLHEELSRIFAEWTLSPNSNVFLYVLVSRGQFPAIKGLNFE